MNPGQIEPMTKLWFNFDPYPRNLGFSGWVQWSVFGFLGFSGSPAKSAELAAVGPADNPPGRQLAAGNQREPGPPKLGQFGRLGPPARCPLSHPFFGWEGSPTKIDHRKKGCQLILTCLLEDPGGARGVA